MDPPLDQDSKEAGTLDLYSNPSTGTSSVRKGGKVLVQTKLPALPSSSLGERPNVEKKKKRGKVLEKTMLAATVVACPWSKPKKGLL